MKKFIETNVQPRIMAFAEIAGGVTSRLMDLAVSSIRRNFPDETEEAIMKALDDAGIRVGAYKE